MPNPLRPHRSGLAAVVLVVLMAAAAACSSSTNETDPTTTIQAMTGTSSVDDEDGPGTTSGPGTTVDEPRTGTTEVDDPEEPPTGDETEADYAAALIASFEGDPDEVFTQADVECIAPKWVAAIGVETFQAAGVTPADIESGDAGLQDVALDRTIAEGIVDAIPECGLDLMELFIDGLPSRVKDDPAKVACVEAAVTPDQVRTALVDEISGAEGPDPEDLAGQCLE